jgi:hypothetical protein
VIFSISALSIYGENASGRKTYQVISLSVKMGVGVAVDRGRIYTDQPVDQVREEGCESHGDLATHTLTQERHFRAWVVEILLHKISAKVERHTLAILLSNRRNLPGSHVWGDFRNPRDFWHQADGMSGSFVSKESSLPKSLTNSLLARYRKVPLFPNRP